MANEDEQLRAEIAFLARLAETEPLASEKPLADGAALVIRLESIGIEVVVEVRLPESVEPLNGEPEHQQGRLLVLMQNISDDPAPAGAPNFILSAGLTLPWHVGIEIVVNELRGEYGEALSWQTHITGAEKPGVLAADVTEIIKKCHMIVARRSG